MYNEHEGPTWTDDHHANWLALKDYTMGPWRDGDGNMNGFDYYEMAEINGLEYFTPNNEDWGAIIVVDNWNKLAAYTHFYEMDDMEYPGSDYAFVTYGNKLMPKFETE